MGSRHNSFYLGIFLESKQNIDQIIVLLDWSVNVHLWLHLVTACDIEELCIYLLLLAEHHLKYLCDWFSTLFFTWRKFCTKFSRKLDYKSIRLKYIKVEHLKWLPLARNPLHVKHSINFGANDFWMINDFLMINPTNPQYDVSHCPDHFYW